MGISKKQFFYLAIIICTIVDLIFLVYISFYPVSFIFKRNVITCDFVLCVIMWIEFIYSYRHAESRRQYLKENYLSIFGMLPLDFIFLRALRLINLFQYIKRLILSKKTDSKISFFIKDTYVDKIVVIAIIFIFMVTILIRIFDTNMTDIQTALWYIITSMTGTGYGDVVPATTSGRIIGVMAMIGGILIFATITAVISSLYVSQITKHNRNSLEDKIDNLTDEIDKLNKKIDELEKR